MAARTPDDGRPLISKGNGIHRQSDFPSFEPLLLEGWEEQYFQPRNATTAYLLIKNREHPLFHPPATAGTHLCSTWYFAPPTPSPLNPYPAPR